MKNKLLTLDHISQNFQLKGKEKTTILHDINLTVNGGEFLAILGPSGAGKSTLLRIIAGLTKSSEGTISYLGTPIQGINPAVSMVFQSFALFPWLTILENVLLGLEGKKISTREKEDRARNILDIVGLDGFEEAYPKELSGGMRQRVGIGRALVSEPDILLMDEAFSALDILTAENLRRDLLTLWLEKKIPTKSIILVTHGIEEAVYMADRAIILSTRPATIRKDLPILLPHWRNRKSQEFLNYVDQIYALMTNPTDIHKSQPISKEKSATSHKEDDFTLLPNVTAGALTGFLEMLVDLDGITDLYKLADRFTMDIEDFFPLVEFSNLMHFTTVNNGDISLTAEGYLFAQEDVLDRKTLFRTHLLTYIPYIKTMVEKIKTDEDQKMDIDIFQNQILQTWGPEKADQQIDLIIGWMRYAELITYDDLSEEVTIDSTSNE